MDANVQDRRCPAADLAWAAAVALLLMVAGGCRDSEPTDVPRGPSDAGTPPPVRVPEIGTVTLRGRTWKVAIAATEARRAAGLSGVTDLAADEGMLFVFERPSVQEFWMHGCRIPLDIAFIGADRRVVATHTMAVEPPGTPPEQFPRYPSGGPVLYALEVRAGTLAQAGVRVGDLVQLPAGLGAAGGSR